MSGRHRSAFFAMLAMLIGIVGGQFRPGMAIADEAAAANSDNQTSVGDKSSQKGNPYLPRKGLSTEDLRSYIVRMEDAPESIRNRPGFAQGVIVAAQRILDTDPKDNLRTFAVIHLLDGLHQQADLENDLDADKQLSALATKYADDPDKQVASIAALYALEQCVLNADSLEPPKLSALLDEVKTSLNGQKLDARHYRIVSATVHAINQLKDDAEATKRLKELGDLFAASKDPVLSRYGKKLSETGSPEGSENQWVGKPMQLAGDTADGAKFDIQQYQGKVVLVDFWATWCGPCRASMPDLKELYEKYHGQGFDIVGVNLDGTPADLSYFLDKEKLPWVNLVGEEKDGQLQFPLAEKYGVQAIPTTFLVSKDGNIAAYNLRGQELTKQVEMLLLDRKEAKPASVDPSIAKPVESK